MLPEPRITLLVHPEVIGSIASWTQSSSDGETGGPMIGTVTRSWDTDGERLIVAVLGTVPPGPALRAGPASVAMGGGEGERASSAVRWWRRTTGIDLRHLGDWHKHHSGMPEPSTGDRLTAHRMHRESDAGVWLTAIAVGVSGASERLDVEGHLVRLTGASTSIGEARFYRETPVAGLSSLDAHVESIALPRLPDLPWHITDAARFGAECRLLASAGFTVAVEPSLNGNGPGLTFRLERDGIVRLAIATGSAYPREAPTAFDDRGKRLGTPEGWTPARFLVDLVKGGR